MNAKTDSYDYIIVGGGTAGCVLASRLSENADTRVLLLEAGASEPLELMAVPPAWPTLQGTSADWGGTTVKQAAVGREFAWPRGRGLGGSSNINGLLFARGHRASYDAWSGVGAKGWDYADLLPFFQRSETTVGRDGAVRGRTGPMAVAPAAQPHPVVTASLDAAVEVGYTRATDISSGLEEGVGLTDVTVVDGRRQSAADAYLTPALARPNLDVVTDALVHQVRVDGGRCTGVRYSTGNQTVTVGCSDEVVLTAGAVGSPQLLMLSGIGPATHLREVGVEVVLDLPGVGANLHDHPMTGITYTASRPLPPSSNNHGEAFGLMRSDPSLAGPDLQVVFCACPIYDPTLQGPAQGYTILANLMSPHSRGSLRLAGADPLLPPLLDPNYLADNRDLDALVTGLGIVREIGRASALDPWRGEEVLPTPDITDDAALRAYVRDSLMTYWHYVGTCRIGMDDMAVVDERLRVRGIDGLRVADASVIPSIPSANTNATVLAIAERAAELLTHS
jgi:choline dehydrogenase